MKKIPNISLLGRPYQSMLWRIVGAIRRQSLAIAEFRGEPNGCIVIAFNPLCQTADEWLGGDLFEKNSTHSIYTGRKVIDSCERYFPFKLSPSGDYIIQRTNPEGGIELVNCIGQATMKIGYALARHRHEYNLYKASLRGDPLTPTNTDYLQDLTAENGWLDHEGCACTTISLAGTELTELCIGISSTSPNREKECVLAGIVEAQCYFEQYLSRVEFSPYIFCQQFPLEQVWRKNFV